MDRREDEVLRKFGQRLNYLREKQNFTISELAERSGLDHALIGEIEAGRVDLEVSVIFALAAGLGVAPGVLVETL